MRHPELGELLEFIKQGIPSFSNVDSYSFVVVDDALMEDWISACEEVIDVFEVRFEFEVSSFEREQGRILVHHEGVDPLPMVGDLRSWFGPWELKLEVKLKRR